MGLKPDTKHITNFDMIQIWPMRRRRGSRMQQIEGK